MTNTKTLKILIAVSLLANLLFIGILCGHVGHKMVSGHEGPPSRHINLRELSEVLPQDKRIIVGPELDLKEREIKGLRNKLLEQRKKAIATVMAEKVDDAAYFADVRAIENTHAMITEKIMYMIYSITKEATNEEKQRITEILNNYLRQ